MALEGAIVAMAAQGHLLALVWHSGSPQGKLQTLTAAIWDVAEQTQVGRTSTCAVHSELDFHICFIR